MTSLVKGLIKKSLLSFAVLSFTFVGVQQAKAEQIIKFELEKKMVTITYTGMSALPYQFSGQVFSRKDTNPYTERYDWWLKTNFGTSIELNFYFIGGATDNVDPGSGIFIQGLRHIMTYLTPKLQDLTIACKSDQYWTYLGKSPEGRYRYSLTMDLRKGSASGCGIRTSAGSVSETF